MYIPYELNKDELACDRRVLMQRYYEAHPEEVERILQDKLDEMVDSVVKPLRARMDLMQGQVVHLHHLYNQLHKIEPKKKTKGVEL